MTEPNWEAPTDAPPVSTPIAEPVAAADAPTEAVATDAPPPGATGVDVPAPKRGRGRPPLTDAQKEARKASNAAKARARRAEASKPKRAASNGPKRGRPAKVVAAPATSENPVLDAIRADAARLRDKIFAAVISGTL